MMLGRWQASRWPNLNSLLVLLFLQCSAEPAWGRLELRAAVPSPIVVPISQNWDGNDGPWSTFALHIGNPPQTVKVLASTASFETWVIARTGCLSGERIDCQKLRGELYSSNDSSTWDPNLSDPSANVYPLTLESNLGYTGKGRYGFDDITLGYIGSNGPTIKNQSMAEIATKSFFLGLLGLDPRPANFTSFNNPIPSFMQNLRNHSMIPSLSWAYTAGNRYRFTEVFGSLILGGYDSSRFIPNNLSFAFSVDTGLTAGLQSITTGRSVSLLPSPLKSITLDSTIPYIYLPMEACTLFENAFGLTWNETAQLYLLNDTQHTALKAQNPTVTFKLGSGHNTIDIALPYSAFDLTASWPLVADPTPYFPLKRAANESQYVLGRTFFQEAYVIANYEAGSFSVSQCKWDASLTANIVTILPPSISSSSKALTTGAKAGIGVGAVGTILLVAMIFYICVFKPRRRKPKPEPEPEPGFGSDIGQETPIDKPVLSPALTADEFLKPELHGNSVPIYEVEGHNPVEISDNSDRVYELPARKPVANRYSGSNEMTYIEQPGYSDYKR